MYVLPLLLTEDAADTEGCALIHPGFVDTLPSAIKNCADVPPLLASDAAVNAPALVIVTTFVPTEFLNINSPPPVFWKYRLFECHWILLPSPVHVPYAPYNA